MSITLFRNLNIGVIPPTPGKDSSELLSTANTIQASNLILEYAKKYGSPISYAQEQNGRLIQDIFPIKKTETQQISSSSKVDLQLHTETAFHPYKPDNVLLLCLRGDPGASTTYALLDEVMTELSADTIDILAKPWFTTSIDDSFRVNGEKDMHLTLSILRSKTDLGTQKTSYEITYDRALMRGTNNDAENALEKLTNAISRKTRDVILGDGDLLVLDNRTMIHGRRAFAPRYDGTDRWLKRVLTIRTTPPRSHIEGHTIITKFGK